MAYIGNDKVVLFLGGTWVYDLSDDAWTQMSPTASPSSRSGSGMAYIGGDQAVLFGDGEAELTAVQNGEISLVLSNLRLRLFTKAATAAIPISPIVSLIVVGLLIGLGALALSNSRARRGAAP